MSAYRAIIFDLGKVVFDLSEDRAFQSWANSSGRSLHDIKSKFAYDEVPEIFETAEISATQFRSIISSRLDIHLSDADFDKGWCDIYLDKYDGIDNLLIDLKGNYKLVALTNTNIIHATVWPLRFAGTLSHFEKIFSSHEIAARKPDAKAFKIVLDYLQCKPAEVIFLDDNADNIHGADELGIETILVTSQEKMRAELKTKGLMI